MIKAPKLYKIQQWHLYFNDTFHFTVCSNHGTAAEGCDNCADNEACCDYEGDTKCIPKQANSLGQCGKYLSFKFDIILIYALTTEFRI